jgi:hypothetical protein
MKNTTNYSLNQFIFNDLFSENANNTNQSGRKQNAIYCAEAHLLDKKTEW